jgi:ATP-dependent helicase HrpB
VESLPIDGYLSSISAALARHRAVVVVAEPGAGKTTRVPPALLDAGPVFLLQPRRAAARAIAGRIAAERNWTLGREVGWHIRFERHFCSHTRLLVATEGVLTARIQQDPLLSSFRTVVLDEFHERSVHADLGIALARQAWIARADLRLVVMSATLDAARVAAFLGDCPVLNIPGRTHPIEVHYVPGMLPADAIGAAFSGGYGDVLCFLPGAGEIDRTIADVKRRLPSQVDVLPLYGALDGAAQDRALHAAPSGTRRVVVATNIAETSVTVPGVTAVVDTGYHKIARYDAARAIDSLITERIPADSAAQRAGRAGRTAPGVVYRLWAESDRLRPSREPELHRVDLSGPILDLLSCGEDPSRFEWFEVPRSDALAAALTLLHRIGALHDGKVTEVGRQMQRLPLHPRLARILIAGHGTPSVAKACALLSERMFLAPRLASTNSDLLSSLDEWSLIPRHIDRVARDIERRASELTMHLASRQPLSESAFRRAILSGYPDRVAQRRAPNAPRVKLASGTGGAIAEESGVRDAEFVVALDVQASVKAGDPDARIRVASAVDRDWLTPTSVERRAWVDDAGVVRAVELERYDALVLSERPVAVHAEEASQLLAGAWLERQRSADDARLLRRLKFAGCDVDILPLVRLAAYDKRSLTEIRLDRELPHDILKRLERDAPETLLVPSGRPARLEYGDDGIVSAAVKLQELFGLGDTPRIGPRQEPVLFSLLAPNGRSVQVTRDLASFWNRTYPEVRKELRGRYPRHPWPDDPWNAPPTARTKRKIT